jgi:hypothetical protein
VKPKSSETVRRKEREPTGRRSQAADAWASAMQRDAAAGRRSRLQAAVSFPQTVSQPAAQTLVRVSPPPGM